MPSSLARIYVYHRRQPGPLPYLDIEPFQPLSHLPSAMPRALESGIVLLRPLKYPQPVVRHRVNIGFQTTEAFLSNRIRVDLLTLWYNSQSLPKFISRLFLYFKDQEHFFKKGKNHKVVNFLFFQVIQLKLIKTSSINYHNHFIKGWDYFRKKKHLFQEKTVGNRILSF